MIGMETELEWHGAREWAKAREDGRAGWRRGEDGWRKEDGSVFDTHFGAHDCLNREVGK